MIEDDVDGKNQEGEKQIAEKKEGSKAAADKKAVKQLLLEREYTFWVFIKSSNRAADDWKPK